MAKKKKQEKRKSWCWYCDREFEDEKILIQHQRMKHFKCNTCHRKLNSASGLVIHMAQVHKDTMEKVPFAVEGHDSPELEIFGTDGIPIEDLQRHQDGLPIVPYTKSKLIIGDASILPILAAQKASVAAQLAESKNYTVQGGASGQVTEAVGIISPTGSGTGSTAINTASSAAEIAATAIPASATAPPIVSPPGSNPAYWNNSFAMAAYYQQQQQPNMYGGPGVMPQYPPMQFSPYSQYPQYPMPMQYPHPPVQYSHPHAQYSHPPAQYPQYPPQLIPLPQQQQDQPFYQIPPSVHQFYPFASPVNIQSERRQEQEQEQGQESVTLGTIQDICQEMDSFDTLPLVIPSNVDSVSGKIIPGTIFTVPSVEKSLEELRSELKKYKFKYKS